MLTNSNMLITAIVIALGLGAVLATVLVNTLHRAKLATIEEREKTQAARSSDLAAKNSELEQSVHSLTERLNSLTVKAAADASRHAAEAASFSRERENMLQDRKSLENSFRAISASTLGENSMRVIDMAKAAFAEQRTGDKSDLAARQLAVEQFVAPVSSALESLQTQIQKMEIERQSAYTALVTKVENFTRLEERMSDNIVTLTSATSGLGQALRNPSVRGQWGEYQLRNIVQHAGMIEHCDFTEQHTMKTDDSSQRPDMIVNMPEGYIVVDAKTPLTAFLRAMEATDDSTQKAELKLHARSLRSHMESLSARGYSKHDTSSPDMVILFVPNEGALSAALAEDPTIYYDAIARNVTILGPNNLVMTLRVLADLWRRRAIEQNTKKIADLGSEFYERITTLVAHVMTLGRSIESSVTAYNRLVGSVDARAVVTARKLKALGVAGEGDVPEVSQITTGTRAFQSPDIVAPAQQQLLMLNIPENRTDEIAKNLEISPYGTPR